MDFLRSLVARPSRGYVRRALLLPVQSFIQTEASGGIILLFAAALAVAWANSPWDAQYFDLWHTEISFDIGVIARSESLQHWVNDGLMVIFFFVVGLEIKRELLHGHLADRRHAMLPIAAAIGGMIGPALIFFALNAGGNGSRGWGIPMATDIAFALGVMALLGRRIPTELRVFLLALAIADDIGAILVIAVFYTDDLSLTALGWAILALVGIVAMNRGGIRNVGAYAVVGVAFWYAVLDSGIHATIAGVILGALTPSTPYFTRESYLQTARPLLARYQAAIERHHGEEEPQAILAELGKLNEGTESPLERLERIIHPWSSYVVLPIFAFANSGVSLSSDVLSEAASSTVTSGVALGLLVGKPVGIMLMTALVVRSGIGRLPGRVTWMSVFGMSLLAGIGFTVSLFIAGLAYDSVLFQDEAKIGVFAGSIISGALGYLLLRYTSPSPVS